MPRCDNCGHLSTEAFKFCPECGEPAAAAAREARKTVTILFCDVVGSTQLGEQLDPESVRRVLSRYFETVRAAVERHGGSVEKFIGDAVMAVFGVPVLHEDDAMRAVRAAAELREALGPLNEELARDYGTTLTLRIGLNTGQVVTGTEERLATGDAVNVAARLEQSAEPGEILLGAATLAHAGNAVLVEPLPSLTLRGKSEPVLAWRLRAVHEEVEGERLSAVPMVGRESELRRLHDAFAQTVGERSCRLITVLGAAGVGKSRLVAEFLAGLDGASVFRGRCLSYGDGITYRPVVEVIKQLQPRFEELAPDRRVLAALQGLLGDVRAVSSTEEIAWAVRKLLEAAAAERPVVCVLDDVNWGEETFLDLVEQVTALARDVPLLVICMARPELLDRRPGWGGGSLNATNVLLEPLSDYETDALIEELLGDVPLEATLRARILGAAEGIPLFVEEMIAMLRDTPQGEISVPATIQALLGARLDQLDTSERAVLERGAVEGRVFHRGAVDALASEEMQLGAILASLVRKDLVRPDLSQLPGEDAYRFRHVLIRDAAYDALPKASRAELHEQLAGWLNERSADVVAADEILGYHLEQSYRYRLELGPADLAARSLATRTSRLLASAGGRALARNDVGAALNFLERALALRSDDDPEVGLRIDLAEVLFLCGRVAAAGDVAAEAADRAAAAGDEAGKLRALLTGARFEAQTPREEPTEEAPSDALLSLAEQARPLFARAGDEVALTEAWVASAWAELIRCRWASMLEAVEHALEHARRAGNARWERELPVWKGTALFYGPTAVDEVLRWHEREHPHHAIALRQRGVLEAMRGRFDKARALLAAGDAAAEELGQTVWLVVGGMAASEVEMLAGDASAAEGAVRTSRRLLEELGDTGYRATATGQLAESLYALGRFDEAERETKVAEKLSAPDDVVSQTLWRQVRAKLLARAGRRAEAERIAREAVSLIEQTDMLNYHAHALADVAEVLRLAGCLDAAEPELEHALTLYERKGNGVLAERARTALTALRETAPATS
jgi:class 3 adenylate cyclase/tetratricopeptide (TPR) repeat protein